MTLFQQIFLIIQIVLISYSSAWKIFNKNPSKLQKFVIDLINQEFWNCILMLFQDGEDNSETFDFIAHSTHINLFNVKFPYPPSNESLHGNQSLPVTFPVTVGNYHRRSPPCAVVVMMIENTRPDYFKEVSRMLSPVFIPILRKDEDHYIFLTRKEITDKLLLIQELPMRIKYKVAIAENPDDGTLVIRSACFYCNEGYPKIVEMKEELNSTYLFPDFVTNFYGRTLRITAPYVRSKIEVEDWVGLNNAKRGHCKYMLEEYLMVKFNFTYTMFVSLGGGGTGKKLSNGTWFGTTGDIVAGNADFGVSTVGTPKRLQAVDYSTQYDYGHLTFVTAKGAQIFTPATLLWPFKLNMWLCCIVSVFCCFILFTFMHTVIKCYNKDRSEVLAWPLNRQILFTIGSMLDQSVQLPIAQPVRFFVALWLFFTLILTTIYRSKMVSLMAFPVMEILPKTFDDLAYSNFKVGFMYHGDSAYNTLAVSTDPVYVKLVAEMKIMRGWGVDCLTEVVKSRFACICYDFSLRHLIQRNLSDQDMRSLVVSPAVTYNIPWCLVMETKAIFRLNFGRWVGYTVPVFLPEIWEKMDFANVRRLKREWWFNTNQAHKAKKSDDVKADDLTLKHFSGAFYVLLAGLLVSVSIFLTEIFKSYCGRDSKVVTKIITFIRLLSSHPTVRVSTSTWLDGRSVQGEWHKMSEDIKVKRITVEPKN